MSAVNAALLSGPLVILIGCAAVWYWRRMSGATARWFWIGVALWTVAIIIKSVVAILANPAVIGALVTRVSRPTFIAVGGLYVGVESALCEIGLTILVGLIWRQLGENAGRAIAVGVGAGAFEAVILGLATFASALAARSGIRGTEQIGEAFQTVAASTPLFWLAAPVERVTAILVHAASRGLVLVGIRHARSWMIALGFVIFTLVDALAGGVQLSGLLGKVSSWWFELLFAVTIPLSLVSIWWLFRHFGTDHDGSRTVRRNLTVRRARSTRVQTSRTCHALRSNDPGRRRSRVR